MPASSGVEPTSAATASGEGFTGLGKGEDGNYYYYVDGVVQEGYTGLVANAFGNWYIENGMARLNYDGTIVFEGIRYLIKAGHVYTDFTGILRFEGGVWYYFSAGVQDMEFCGFVTRAGMQGYVENGEVNFNKTGIVSDNGVLKFVKYGIWRDTYTGLARREDGQWLYMNNGIFDATYTGAAKLNDIWVYVNSGMVDARYNGTVIVNNATYVVKYGIIVVTDVSKPVIVQQPQSATATLGQEATLSVTATGTGLRYVWCIRDRASDFFSKTTCTDTTFHMEMSLQTHDCQVYCEVSDVYGNLAFSDFVTVSVRVDDAATPLKIQVFGDSASSETYNDCHTWVSNLQAVLPQYDLTVVNSAVGGNTLIHWNNPYAVDNGDGTYSSLDKGVTWQVCEDYAQIGSPETSGANVYAPLEPDADLVIVWAGSNDWAGCDAHEVLGDISELTVGEYTAECSNIEGSYLSPGGEACQLYTIPVAAFSTDCYKVTAGETYRIYGQDINFFRAMPLGMFTSASQVINGITTGTVISSDDGSVCLENSLNTPTDYDFSFTPATDGYILIARCNGYPALQVNHMAKPDPTTIYGAVRLTIEAIREKCPQAKILFLTPMQRYDLREPARPVDPVTGDELNGCGISLVQVVDAIKEACDFYGVPCVDMYRESGFDRENFQPKGQYTPDGLHPNGAADMILARLIGEKIAEILAE